jgi:hypothetical protein
MHLGYGSNRFASTSTAPTKPLEPQSQLHALTVLTPILKSVAYQASERMHAYRGHSATGVHNFSVLTFWSPLVPR